MKSDTIITIPSINLSSVSFDKNGHIIPGLGNIKETVVCLRPGHKSGLPQIYAELKNNKIISHNYCHGGSGWSLLFGSVKESIINMENLVNDKNISITIVGMGCIGLVTALNLYYDGYKNINIIAERFENTASFYAGGLVEYLITQDNSSEKIKTLNNLLIETFKVYQEIINNKHKYIKRGVRYVDFYTNHVRKNVSLDYLSSVGIIPKPKKVNIQIHGTSYDLSRKYLDFEINKQHENDNILPLTHYKTFHIITQTVLNDLYEHILNLKIPIKFKKIESFSEVESKVIFNCSGLGSYTLNNDKDVYPICGLGLVLKEENYSKHNYIISVNNIEPYIKENKGTVYYMPKLSGFVGGTYFEGYDGKDDNFNKVEFLKLLDRSNYLFNRGSNVKFEFKPKF